MIKSALRKIYQEKRQRLNPEEYQQMNTRLCENFFRHVGLSGVSLIHTFLPVTRNKEPDTWNIIQGIWRDSPHIRIAVPRISGDGQKLDSVVMEKDMDIRPNSWGIPEPVEGLVIDPQEIDVVLVPLLVFDRTGNRVGYGKGFYDKFLPRCKPNCRRIGVSLFEPVDIIADINTYDQRLTGAITPDHWYIFN